MAEKIHEQVSALMDDECAPEEIGLAVRRLERDAALQACWQRYHLISDVIKGSAPMAIDREFGRRMTDMLDREPPLADNAASRESAPARTLSDSTSPAWRKPAIGFALAASVAAVTVFALRPGSDVSPLLATGDEGMPLAEMPSNPVDSGETRLNAYLVNHNSLASMSSVHGVMPYVRMASYQNGR